MELTLYFIFHMFKEYLIEGWNKYTLLKDVCEQYRHANESFWFP